jgi:FdrA protein
MSELSKLFADDGVRVVNVGLPSFAEDLRAQGKSVVHVDWRPPAGGNKRILDLLEKIARSQQSVKES